MKRAKENDDIYITVEDNGFGMPQEVVDQLLDSSNKHAPHHGSGVGLINVHERIQLRFGANYGLSIASEADHGTKVTIHLPAVLYTEENHERLENGTMDPEAMHEKQ